LRSRLRKYLADMSAKHYCKIELIPVECEEYSGTAVSTGAVISALNKHHGPRRIARSSYGFLRNEPYDKRTYPSHRYATSFIDKTSGERYVKTINYFLIIGARISHNEKFERFISIHLFPVDEEKLICEEIVYVSDYAKESHWAWDDNRNKEAEIAGRLEVDMTFLKTQGLVQPTLPEQGLMGRTHYKVAFEIYAYVDGMSLKYAARYPQGEGGEVRATGQINIAAAFKPGTA